MSTRSNTANHHKNILIKELKLTQVANTSIFKQKNYFILSPSVQNDHWWFDLRKVNLVKFNKEEETGYLLIRFFDQFLVCNLREFIQKKMISKENYAETAASGIHWKFNIIQKDGQYIVINQKDKSQYPMKEVSVRKLKKKFNPDSL